MAANNTLNVTKATSVASIKRQFKHDYGLHLEIYYGNNRIADDAKKIHEICDGEFKGGELVMGMRCRVGNVEKYFEQNYGVKCQVKYDDGGKLKLAPDTYTLNQAKKL